MQTDPNVPAPVTFARSFRAMALSVYLRPEDRQALNEDVKWLLQAHRGGAYMYDDSWPPSAAEQVAAATARQGDRDHCVASRGTFITQATGTKLGAQSIVKMGPANYKTNNTYVNHQPNNFYWNHKPDNFYFGRDTCIPSKGIAVASSSAGSSAPPKSNTTPPSSPPTATVGLGVYEPRMRRHHSTH